jgi:hypothetical protein
MLHASVIYELMTIMVENDKIWLDCSKCWCVEMLDYPCSLHSAIQCQTFPVCSEVRSLGSAKGKPLLNVVLHSLPSSVLSNAGQHTYSSYELIITAVCVDLHSSIDS